jgi:zinc transporter ZupT
LFFFEKVRSKKKKKKKKKKNCKMDIILVKFLCLFALFLVAGAFAGMPLLLRNVSKGRRDFILMLGNAFAGGVFFASGFLHLIQEANEALESDVDFDAFNVSFALASLGFAVTFFIEKVAFSETNESSRNNSALAVAKSDDHAQQTLKHGHDATTHSLSTTNDGDENEVKKKKKRHHRRHHKHSHGHRRRRHSDSDRPLLINRAQHGAVVAEGDAMTNLHADFDHHHHHHHHRDDHGHGSEATTPHRHSDGSRATEKAMMLDAHSSSPAHQQRRSLSSSSASFSSSGGDDDDNDNDDDDNDDDVALLPTTVAPLGYQGAELRLSHNGDDDGDGDGVVHHHHHSHDHHSHHGHDDEKHHHHHHHHGHSDDDGHDHTEHVMALSGTRVSLMAYLLVFILSFHSVIAGFVIGLQSKSAAVIAPFLAIVAHKWCEAFALGVSLLRQQVPMRNFIKAVAIYSCMVPLGIVLGMIIQVALDSAGMSNAGEIVTAVFTAFAGGTFIYVAVVDILVEEFARPASRRTRYIQFALAIGGYLVMLGLLAGFGDDHDDQNDP